MPYDDWLTNLLGDRPVQCPVCGAGGVGQVSKEVAMQMMVTSLLSDLRARGRLQARSPRQFWTRYSQHLCTRCRAEVEQIRAARRRAVELLTEAVQLDRRNTLARQNLKTVRKMIEDDG